MPMFTYKCKKCGHEMEKFHHGQEMPDLICEKCESTEFERLFPQSLMRKQLNAQEMIEEQIKPDADRITNKIASGSDADFLDLHGEK